MRIALIAALPLLLAGCGDKPSSMEDLTSTVVTLPDGTKIIAQAMREPIDMERGMMFRDSLAPNHGMIFYHGKMGKYAYWTYQNRIPLDFLWIDEQHHIVEMELDKAPCPSKAAHECPTFGGDEEASYVLELNAGDAAKHRLKVGDSLDF